MPELKVIETSTCETIYDLDGEQIRLWIITGGTPAIAFAEDYSFTERFPTVERWTSKHWNDGRRYYDHQDPANIVGPTVEEVLPNGVQTLLDWHKKNKPLHELRVDRWEQLQPYWNLQSRRFHDQENGCYFHLKVGLASHYITSSIGVESPHYSIRLDQRSIGWVTQEPGLWVNLNNTLKACYTNNGSWETLSEEKFAEVLDAFAKVLPLCP